MDKCWLEELIEDRADWLVDAVATSTQNRSFLRGDPEEDVVATEAIKTCGVKAMQTLVQKIVRDAEEEENKQ